MDPTASPKAYWSILKTVLNNKKIRCIPPIYQNNNYITDFKEKAQIFNNFFAKQCKLVENTSKLPIDSSKRTNNLLSTNSLTKDDIANIIQNLNPNKAYGFNMISIRMLKICGDLILKPLELIFRSCIECVKSCIVADGTSLFSVIYNINSTANDLNNDLMKISNWAFQWKMRFNPDPNKQAQEVILSRKINKILHLLYI